MYMYIHYHLKNIIETKERPSLEGRRKGCFLGRRLYVIWTTGGKNWRAQSWASYATTARSKLTYAASAIDSNDPNTVYAYFLRSGT